ncbi:hypothetical protein [Glycomyces tritici]|uniref:DUF3558 domain-containing protein n=1 Tax=Glycomyces tritici TaxID=2665176 RepID=A0ABT7YWJ2_9ACTN|nr:hypothetical protein [Glycomyces tritici]MDN3243016.1 hypothetical protein [Glycomyces tritici]
MRSANLVAVLVLAAAVIAACGEDTDPEYWVEDGDPIVIRGESEPGNPDILNIAGELGYDTATQCLFIDHAGTRFNVVWHVEALPAHSGDSAGVEVHTPQSPNGALYEGDLVAGYNYEVKPAPTLPADCLNERTIAVFEVSNLSQQELRDVYATPDS